jgi:stage III sporulation protein AD
MDTILKCAGVAVIGAILGLLTRKSEFGILVSIAAVGMLLTMAMTLLRPILTFADTLQETAELGETMMRPVMKTLAIGFLTETGKSICEDAGEKTIGNALSLVGGIGGLYVLLPLLESVLELLETLL